MVRRSDGDDICMLGVSGVSDTLPGVDPINVAAGTQTGCFGIDGRIWISVSWNCRSDGPTFSAPRDVEFRTLARVGLPTVDCRFYSGRHWSGIVNDALDHIEGYSTAPCDPHVGAGDQLFVAFFLRGCSDVRGF